MPETLFTGQQLIELETTESTNSFAKELLRESRPAEGTLITTREQTAGKGQAGNTWLSEPAVNLTLSYIFYPTFLNVEKQFYLNMAVSLALRECCEQATGLDFHIKWPNDIYAGDEKVAGVLIENTISGSKISSSVVGIGLNVNQTFFDLALPNATSLRNVHFENYNLEKIRDSLSHYIEKYYLQLRQQHYNFLYRAYTESLFRYQQTARFVAGKKEFRGQIIGVSKEGKLLIESEGKERSFGMREVAFVI